jgi:hypothetical protein
MMDSGIEEAVVRAFIVPAKRKQYVSRLGLPKARQSFMNGHLFHMRDLDPRYATRIDPVDQHSAKIFEMLTARGAPHCCYVISASSDLDGTGVELKEALDAMVGTYDGSFLSCVHGKLAYFEGEEANERYILAK